MASATPGKNNAHPGVNPLRRGIPFVEKEGWNAAAHRFSLPAHD
jgi:hypothetical protein